MGTTFTDQDGQEKYLLMGAYGIGIERTMAIIVESHHDDKGIIWPKIVAPFAVHLVGLDIEKTDKVYEELKRNGIDVLYDDRDDVSAGVKFADADLIGIPVRLVVSAKTGDKIEYKERAEKEAEVLSLEEVIQKINS